jgi:hypothetical protein
VERWNTLAFWSAVTRRRFHSADVSAHLHDVSEFQAESLSYSSRGLHARVRPRLSFLPLHLPCKGNPMPKARKTAPRKGRRRAPQD